MLQKSLAYSVHFFTVLGVYFSYLALVAAVENNLPLVFLYLAIALFIDGIDGTLARWADVKTFADGLQTATKKGAWVEPEEFWDVGSILKDLNNIDEKINRKEYYFKNINLLLEVFPSAFKM